MLEGNLLQQPRDREKNKIRRKYRVLSGVLKGRYEGKIIIA